MHVLSPAPTVGEFACSWSRVMIATGQETARATVEEWDSDADTVLGDQLLSARAWDGEALLRPSGRIVALRPIFGMYMRLEPTPLVFGAGNEIYRPLRPASAIPLATLTQSELAAAKRIPGFLINVWTDGTWVLRSAHVNAGLNGTELWDVERLSGGSSRILAFGAVGLCGNPIVDAHALGIDWPTGDILRIPFERGKPVERMTGIPLTASYCLAGRRDLVAVTGAKDGRPAVALYSNNEWQVVVLPGSLTIGEPHVFGDGVFVAMPGSDVREDRIGATVVAGAGAVFALGRNSVGRWTVERTILPDSPARRGWLGMALGYSSPYLVLEYMVWPPGTERMDRGTGSVCRARLK